MGGGISKQAIQELPSTLPEGAIKIAVMKVDGQVRYVRLMNTCILECYSSPDWSEASMDTGFGLCKVRNIKDIGGSAFKVETNKSDYNPGQTFLFRAVNAKEKSEWVNKLLKLRRKIKELAKAIKKDDVEAVKKAFDKDKLPLTVKFHKLQSPLHMAATHGALNVAAHLITERNMNIEELCMDGTPLHRAAEAANPTMVKFLLERGATCHTFPLGQSPLEALRRTKCTDMAIVRQTETLLWDAWPLTKEPFVSLQFGFQIRPPLEWVSYDDAAPNCVVKWVPPSFTRGEDTIQELKVLVEKPKLPLSLRQYVSASKSGLKLLEMPNLKFLSEEGVGSLNGSDCIRLSFSFDAPSDTAVLNITLLMTIVRSDRTGAFYNVTYVALSDTFVTRAGLGVKAVNTFSLL